MTLRAIILHRSRRYRPKLFLIFSMYYGRRNRPEVPVCLEAFELTFEPRFIDKDRSVHVSSVLSHIVHRERSSLRRSSRGVSPLSRRGVFST